jgi:hypothetical protein
MTAWLLLAFGLLQIRRAPVNWTSFRYAAAAPTPTVKIR